MIDLIFYLNSSCIMIFYSWLNDLNCTLKPIQSISSVTKHAIQTYFIKSLDFLVPLIDLPLNIAIAFYLSK
jgi:hypothetical protein